MRGEKNGEGKGIYFEKENILFVEVIKNGEGKGGEYLEKGNIFFFRSFNHLQEAGPPG